MDGNTEDPVEVQPLSVADDNANESAEGTGMDENNAEGSTTEPEPIENKETTATNARAPAERVANLAEIADTAVVVQDTSVPTEGIAQEGEIPTDVEEVHSPLPIAVSVPINNNNNQASSGSEPADEEDQNLITPVRNINRYLTDLEANHPVQTYITTEEHHDTISQLLHKMDYIASVMQNIVSYREEDHQKYEQTIATAVTAQREDLAAMREEI